jgi:hypothetical protein
MANAEHEEGQVEGEEEHEECNGGFQGAEQEEESENEPGLWHESQFGGWRGGFKR